MRKVLYGSKLIQYRTAVTHGLKSHYITVDKHSGVVLKGERISPEKGDQLVIKKAKWILQKLEVVKAVDDGAIVSGSRLTYLGRSYYVEVVVDTKVEDVTILFNHSKFKIVINNNQVTQKEIQKALEKFYKAKAHEKIISRAKELSNKHNFSPTKIQIRKMNQRWGSCTTDNKIIINQNAVKLPYTLIDYLIVHEFCHIKVKDHSKKFYAELSKHVPHWKYLDERISEIKV